MLSFSQATVGYAKPFNSVTNVTAVKRLKQQMIVEPKRSRDRMLAGEHCYTKHSELLGCLFILQTTLLAHQLLALLELCPQVFVPYPAHPPIKILTYLVDITPNARQLEVIQLTSLAACLD